MTASRTTQRHEAETSEIVGGLWLGQLVEARPCLPWIGKLRCVNLDRWSSKASDGYWSQTLGAFRLLSRGNSGQFHRRWNYRFKQGVSW